MASKPTLLNHDRADIIPDAFGIDFVNNKILADTYIFKPYHFFWAMYGFIPWIIRNQPGKSFPIVKAFFEALRKEVGQSTPIGAAGICWGGKHIVLLANPEHKVDDKPMYDGGFTGHPSFLAVPKDIQKVAIAWFKVKLLEQLASQ
ncbi:hypothetical protein VSDG_07559 [Cytospora chrysosperma]|uniref:Dienelactone hydrolase domain-containing protein n=1 Tax=Cytospora chrysosperma TaxID=252740 RepID=A0A423VMB0_CYTCH|nr:hypothetical protein VSDG_07559 [Valsa sordida]